MTLVVAWVLGFIAGGGLAYGFADRIERWHDGDRW